MLANYGNQVDDFNQEEKETGFEGGDRAPIFRQNEIPIYVPARHVATTRTFWFAPIPKNGVTPKDWETAITPVWRVFRHYVPLPAGSEKKGFVTTCSGNHDVLRAHKDAVDPDNCEVCRYIESTQIGRINRAYVMLAFNYSIRGKEIDEWIKAGDYDPEIKHTAANFPAKLWLTEWSSGVYNKLSDLRKRDGTEKDVLHLYRVTFVKEETNDRPAPLNVKYSVGFEEADFKSPPEYTEMELKALNAFAAGVDDGKGEKVQIPNIGWFVNPTSREKQLQKLAQVEGAVRRSDAYAANRFGEDRKVQPREEKEAVGAAPVGSRFSRRFGKDEEEGEVQP